ncbi:MAG: sensor histidine kinase [Pseudomonadota bacterium]
MILLSPRTSIAATVTLTLLVCALAIALALSAPGTGLSLVPAADATDGIGLEVTAAGGAAETAGLKAGDRIVAFIAGNERVPARHELVVEDPDGIPGWPEYRAMMAAQTALAAALDNGGHLGVVLADGRELQLQATQRHPGDLPVMFWLQLLFGVGGALTGTLVLAARPADRATRLYFLTGIGFLIFAPAAAVYSTRELVLSGDVFRALSLANHFGALLFTASLTSLLWVYPVSPGRVPVVALCYLAALAAWLADVLQLGPDNTLSPTTVLLIFALSFVFAGRQWWRTRRAPAERAALRWFLLSIYLATGLFAGVILIPNALGVPPPASQGVMFGAFLIMYWGLALGVTRYRLFDIDSWWRAIWWWFLGGIAVVVLDIVLVSMLALSDALALSISVAVVGWLYFPVRQWLWARFGKPRARTLDQWLPDVLPLLIETRPGQTHEAQIRERWPGVLAAVFRPLETTVIAGTLATPEIRENGLALAIPDARNEQGHLLLRHADRGERLFNGNDLETLAALRELFDLALDRLRARDSGARIERERIRRDIHDDIGAKLLTLLHTSPEQNQPLVREALEDLRTLVRALEFDGVPLRDALDAWQAEARKRTEAAAISLQWQESDVAAEAGLNARQHANLARVVREAISNALRHARPTRLSVSIAQKDNRLQLHVTNDGTVKPVTDWAGGRGRQIMQGRIRELGGDIGWRVDNGECTLQVSVPL